MQRKGIATQLLKHVCKDATNDGFSIVEAYVNKKFIEADYDFRGPIEMYEKCGFIIHAEQDDKLVVRKALKEP